MQKDEQFDVYLQFQQNIPVYRQTVKLRDIADICCTDAGMRSSIGSLVIATLKKDERHRVLSAMDVVRIIRCASPGATVTVLGENEFILTLASTRQTPPLCSFLGAALVCLITFFGAAFSVASFNNDVDIALLFDQILKTAGHADDFLPWLQISYSIGIPLGILIFYNHLSKKKMTEDPTPLEVEMQLYEQEENTAIIRSAEREAQDAAG